MFGQTIVLTNMADAIVKLLSSSKGDTQGF